MRSVVNALLSAAALYLPQLAFSILAPIIIFQGDLPEQNMLFFYACTFGVGLLSSGFSNTTHYLVQKNSKREGLINFAGIYSLVRLLAVIGVYLFGLQFTFLGINYSTEFIVLLILSSLPSWAFLYVLGLSKLPTAIAWVENTLKLVVLYFCIFNDQPIWYFLIITTSLNLIITFSYLFKVKFLHWQNYKLFVTEHVAFITSGALFSIAWLIFMSNVLNSQSLNSAVIVALERMLRVFERLSSVLTTLIFRKNKKTLSKRFHSKLLNINNKILPVFLIIIAVLFYYVDTLFLIFLVSILNVFWGQLLQQLVRPNRLFNLGGIAQALLLIVPFYFFTLPNHELYNYFLLGCVMNFIIRRQSLMLGKTK